MTDDDSTRKGHGDTDVNYIEFNDEEDNEHIHIHGEKHLFFDAKNVYGEYFVGSPDLIPAMIKERLNELFGDPDDDRANPDQTNLGPTNLLPFDEENQQTDADGNIVPEHIHNVLEKAHVRVLKADSVLIQDGNVYNFGGWEYSLGNGYSEEHMDENAELNQTEDWDLADKGGPHWEKINVYKNDLIYKEGLTIGSKPGKSDVMIGEESDWEKDEIDGTNLWVEKSYGNSYSYKNGHEIEVKKKDSLSISHGGTHVALKFRNDGSLSAWSRSGGGNNEEKKWTNEGTLTYHSNGDFEKKWTDKGTLTYHGTSGEGTSTERKYCRLSGDILSYSTSHTGYRTVNSHSFQWANTASSSFSFSSAAGFKFSASASLSLDISLAFDISVAFKAAGKIDITKSTGAFVEIKNQDVDIKIPGLRIKREAPVKAVDEVVNVKNSVVELKKSDSKIEKTGASITSPILKLFL